MTDSRKVDPLKQPLLGKEEVLLGSGPVCQSPGLAAQSIVEEYPSHPSSADHSRHSIPQDEEQAEPLLPKSKPSAGPAYDSLTSFSSHAQRPGQGIPQPDGSVLPISVTHDITSLPSNQFNVHEGFPPQQGTAAAEPAPQTTSAHLQPLLTATTPEAGCTPPIPPKGDATVGPAPEHSSYLTHIPPKGGAIAGPAPEKRSMANWQSSSAVTGPAPQFTNPCGPYDPVMSIQPQPMSPQPLQSIFPQPQPEISHPPPQPMPPQPVLPQPPTVQYQQPHPLPAFPPSQYQPYQPAQPPQSSNATAVQVPTTPYILHRDQTQQGGVVQQPISPHAVKTSFKFDAKTLCDNQFYIAFCLLISVTVSINPLGLTCTIPALIYAYKAARANKQNSYVEALKYHKNARICNIGAFITVALYSAILVVVVLLCVYVR